MKLAYLTSRFPFAGLGETYLEPEVRRLRRLCEEVHVIPARPQSRANLFPQLGCVALRLSPGAPVTLWWAALEAVRRPLAAVRALASIVLPRYPFGAKLKNIVVFPKALAVTRYVRTHGIDHIHANWLTTASTIAYVAHQMTGVPWSCTAHAHDIFSGNLLAQKRASAQFIRFIAERNRRHFLKAAGKGGGTTTVIHLGVDVPIVVHAPEPGRPLQVVCAARLDPIKGHRFLLQALSLLRDAGTPIHCDIVGSGPLEQPLRALAAELRLEEILTFRGTVDHRALLQDLRGGCYDLAVLPSLEMNGEGKHEGIPVALMEAMACGLCCVATATGCIPELIDRETGVLVEQRSARELARVLGELAADPGRRSAIGAAARKRILAEFDSVNTTRELYARMTGAPRPAIRETSQLQTRSEPPGSRPRSQA